MVPGRGAEEWRSQGCMQIACRLHVIREFSQGCSQGCCRQPGVSEHNRCNVHISMAVRKESTKIRKGGAAGAVGIRWKDPLEGSVRRIIPSRFMPVCYRKLSLWKAIETGREPRQACHTRAMIHTHTVSMHAYCFDVR